MMSEPKELSAALGSHNFHSTSNSNMSQKQPLQDSRSSDKSLRTPFFAIQQPRETFSTYISPRKQKETQQTSLPRGPNAKQKPISSESNKENNFKSELIMGKGKLKSEKSYRDLNKSLANLARSPDSFTSLSDPQFQYQSISSNHGPKVPSFQFQSDQAKKNPRALYEKKLSHPVNIKRDFEKSSFANENNFYTQQKEKHHQARTGVSNVELPSRIRDISPGLPKYPYSSNMNYKYLLTEGDSPTGRDDFLEARFSENLTQRISSKYQKAPATQDPNKFTLKNPEEVFKELSLGVTENQQQDKRRNPTTVTEEDKEQEKFITTHMTSSNLTPSFVSIPQSKKSKMVTQESLKEETIFQLKRMNEDQNNGQLDLNSISEGVQYTNGGCGYGDKRKQVQKPPKSNEKINKETFRSWKKDLQKIQEEMNRRKGSYEKVNKFLNMCDDINDNNIIDSPPSVKNIDEGSGSHLDGFDSQRYRQSQITPKVSRDIPNSSIYSPLNSTFNATRINNKSHNNGQISDRDRSFERQVQPIVTFSDIRITEDEEQRFAYENNIIQELDESIPQRRVHEINLNSFVCGHENCNKCVRAPCCGRNSNCQIF